MRGERKKTQDDVSYISSRPVGHTNDNMYRKAGNSYLLVISIFFSWQNSFVSYAWSSSVKRVMTWESWKSACASMHGDGRTSFTVQAFPSSQHNVVTGRRQDMVVSLFFSGYIRTTYCGSFLTAVKVKPTPTQVRPLARVCRPYVSSGDAHLGSLICTGPPLPPLSWSAGRPIYTWLVQSSSFACTLFIHRAHLGGQRGSSFVHLHAHSDNKVSRIPKGLGFGVVKQTAYSLLLDVVKILYSISIRGCSWKVSDVRSIGSAAYHRRPKLSSITLITSPTKPRAARSHLHREMEQKRGAARLNPGGNWTHTTARPTRARARLHNIRTNAHYVPVRVATAPVGHGRPAARPLRRPLS